MRLSRSSTSASSRGIVMLVVSLAVAAFAAWGVTQVQRGSNTGSLEDSVAGQKLLTAMLDQETGLRGYALNRKADFLEPYLAGRRELDAALVAARRRPLNADQRAALEAASITARQWQGMAQSAVVKLRRQIAAGQARSARPSPQAEQRKLLFDRFRTETARFQRATAARSVAERSSGHAGVLKLGLAILVCFLLGGFGYWVIERDIRRGVSRSKREREYRKTQSEFAETMQIMRDEQEAHGLLKRHIERSVPDTEVTVLNRNNSDNRLTATTIVEADSKLAPRLLDAKPESCLAVRLGRTYTESPGDSPLLSCEVCHKTAAEISCVPSLVSGEVIGSVLVQGARPLDREGQDRVNESVSQAAPVLGTLRSLAIAETRAATDALTGLPNARACRDHVKRVVAHAGRTLEPLSAIVLDLDHFKQINDRFGHGAGDDVLASVGGVLAGAIRGSDFAGRHGGEEFLMLLPNTDREGALAVAEKVRENINAVSVKQVDREISASLGVASFPEHAVDADSLLRAADRALYSAKAAGRNRVEVPQDGDDDGSTMPEAPAAEASA